MITLIIFTLITLSIGSVSAADVDNETLSNSITSDDIGISNVTNQINAENAFVNEDEIIENDVESDDIISASNDEDLLRGDVSISVVGGKSNSYNVGDTVYLKLGTEKSSYTPANIYVQVQGGGYTDNYVGTYSEATSSTGVPMSSQILVQLI